MRRPIASTSSGVDPATISPVMNLLTSKKEREVIMEQAREVTKFERIAFPIVSTIFISLLLPSITALLGMLMLGNLFRESGVTDRLSDTAQNALINTVTIFLALGTGLTMSAESFLVTETLLIICLGLVAFIFGTAGGVVLGKIMCRATGWKINPLIGSAGVSAVPMAARVSQIVGIKAKPGNYLLMHAMGPNVAGVIGTAVAAGTMLAVLMMLTALTARAWGRAGRVADMTELDQVGVTPWRLDATPRPGPRCAYAGRCRSAR